MSEFQRKVRTLAGNFQLFQLAPWTLTPQNQVLFQLISHKVCGLSALPSGFYLPFPQSFSLSGHLSFFTAFAALFRF